MGCCGKKREALRSSVQQNAGYDGTPDHTRRRHQDRQKDTLFCYTGNSSLTVNGFFKSRVYHFTRDNPQLMVNAEDVAIMRGYSELTVILPKVT